MPSAPAGPRVRELYALPRAAPAYETFQWYEAGRLVLDAVTTFQEVKRFSGKPDSIILSTNSAGVRFRLRNLAEPGGDEFQLDAVGDMHLKVAAEIVEARDATGLGGAQVTAIGRYGSRDIEGRAARVARGVEGERLGSDQRKKRPGGID
jgi:hypothetical protein